MGRGWIDTVRGSDAVELAGIIDLDRAAAEAARPDPDVPVATSLAELAGTADFVIDVTVPVAHYPVTTEALRSGLPVLGEKPLAATMAEAVQLVEAAHSAEELFVVSQNRRYDPQLFALKAAAERLGGVGILTHEFFKAPHFGGFRDAMDHPLVLDMAIHNFDAARFLLDAEPVAVYCEEYNPAWSWYSGDAASTAIFEMTGGIRFIYTGSWCSPGLETAWNSVWRVSGRNGTASWDGESAPEVELVDESPDVPTPTCLPGLAGSLDAFVTALRTGVAPMGEVADNLGSLAMVHAAIESARTGTRVRIEDVIAAASG